LGQIEAASSLLHAYNFSISNVLSNVYPEYEWLPWRFEVIPKSYWAGVNNQIKFMRWVEQKLKIKELEDWYNVELKVPWELL
jgi:hypothetical protein